jgi:ribosome-associated protein
VELRFNLAGSSLPRAVRERLAALAAGRLNRDGILTIKAHRFRTQQANRQEALARLVALARRAAQPPKQRLATTPTRGSRERRLAEKRRQAERKRGRAPLAKIKRLDD